MKARRFMLLMKQMAMPMMIEQVKSLRKQPHQVHGDYPQKNISRFHVPNVASQA